MTTKKTEMARDLIPGVLTGIMERQTTEETMSLPQDEAKLAEWNGVERWMNDWKPEGIPELVKMKLGAVEFGLQIQNPGEFSPRWISFLGPSGTGKTLLAMCLWRFYHRSAFKKYPYTEHPGKVIFWPDVVDQIQKKQWGNYEDARAARFLLIDDIGAEHDPSGYGKEKLCSLLTFRKRKWTVITSNFRMREMMDYDQRVASRLVRDESRVFENDAADWNSKRRKEGRQ